MMISLILLFPLFACIMLFVFKKKFLNDICPLLYAVIHSVATVMLILGFNPFDINTGFFEIDKTNGIFLGVLSLVNLAVMFYNRAYMKEDNNDVRKVRHYTYALLLFVLSMTGAILSTNLGVTWIFIEATTLASAYLIYFHKTKHSIEAAWKYVFICSIGIALAFVGIILLTIASGNLNSLFFNDLYNNAPTFNVFWLKISFVFILFGIGTKMGLAPMHFWLPDAHAQSPSPVSALLSATLLNTAYLMILKVYKITIIAGCDSYARLMLFVTGFLSLFIAAVFIYHINNYKRMLAYSSIENMGILIIGTALGGIGAIASMIHLIGHSLIKASFFLTSGNVLKLYGTKKINSVTGLISKDNTTGWLWILSFVGIAAFPPSILFVSEFLIVKTMILKGHYILCGLFLVLLTIILYGLSKAVISTSFGENKNVECEKLPISMYVPQIILLTTAFVLGIFLPFSDILINAVKGL